MADRSILKDIAIRAGRAGDILSSFVLCVEVETRRHGVALEFSTPEALLSINEKNSTSWKPLVPMFNPRYGIISPANSLSVLGRNMRGEPVTANSIIKYDWRLTNFLDEATSLRLFYRDPQGMKRPGEECVVTSSRVRQIRGQAASAGAAWIRPDYRGLGLSDLLPRLIKAYALASWDLDVIFGMMTEAVHERGFATRFGYNNSDREAHWINSILGTMRLAVLWTDTNYLAEDLKATLAAVTSQLDTRVIKGNA
jgi:hypothetical protein